MFDLYAGSQAKTVDKDKSTVTGEKFSLTLHAAPVAAAKSPRL